MSDSSQGGSEPHANPFDEIGEGSEELETVVFQGHDAGFAEDLRYTAPEMAAAHTLASASAHGSPQARRRAKVLVFFLIGFPIALIAAVAIGKVLG